MTEDFKNNENIGQKPTENFKREFAPHRRICIKVCKSCGEIFTIADNDIVYYVQTYGSIPLLCPRCREKKKQYFDLPQNNN